MVTMRHDLNDLNAQTSF